MSDTFWFWGEEHTYFDHPYNTTGKNERAVEIPIVCSWIAENGIDVEIGNVLGHYGDFRHRVVDKYEEADGVENIDIFDLDGPLGSVVAISTLEHVRFDAPEPFDLDGSIQALAHLHDRSDRLLVTVPLGHHPRLDHHLLALEKELEVTRASTMIRSWAGWVETVVPVWAPYGSSTRWAEAVWIGEFL